jgi:hypothetical protein
MKGDHAVAGHHGRTLPLHDRGGLAAGQLQLLKGKKILPVGIRRLARLARLARLGRGVNGLEPELEVSSVASLAIGISAWRVLSSSHFMEVAQSEWLWD